MTATTAPDSTQNGDPAPRNGRGPGPTGKQIAEVRRSIHAAVGQVVLALSVVPRYRHQSIADLQTLVLEPLMRDRVAIATAAPSGRLPERESEGATKNHAPSGLPAVEPGSPAGESEGASEMSASENDAANTAPLAGIAFWASVSDAVDAKIREQIKGGAFPIRLKPEEWNSGDTVWLFDVIAPSQKMASAVLANFKQVVAPLAAGSPQGSRQGPANEVRIHPIVARQVDPELLRKMGAVAEGGAG